MDIDHEKIRACKITNIQEFGTGMRACLDFIDILDATEGIFIGNTGHGGIKVLSETSDSDYAPARAFRVNAGAIHQYVFINDMTSYLAEIASGHDLMVYHDATCRQIKVGRTKWEKRDFIKITCAVSENESISAILQKADSVHVQSVDGHRVPITELSIDDEIFVFTSEPGRHKGQKIDEDIIER